MGANNENSEFAGTITNVGGYNSGGAFFIGNYTHLTKVGTGKLTLSGTSNTYNGNLTVNGGEVAVTGTLQGNSRSLPNTVSVANTAKLTISGILTATNLTFDSGSEVIITPGKKLTLDGGTLTNNGSFTLQSDNENGTATFVNKGNAIVSSAIVNQHLSSIRNWYISSPVSTIAPPGFTYYQYDEPAASWTSSPVTAGVTTLVAGKGYIAVPTSTGNITFSGRLNDGPVAINLTRQGSTSAGFNLVGNPYPSFLDAAALLTANRPEGNEKVENNIWFRTRSGIAYQFQTYNASGNESVPQAANPSYIPPMQGFWVRALANNVTLNFTNAMRKHNETAGSILLRAPAVSETQRIRLQVSNGAVTDEMLVYTHSDASDSYDRFDARKFTDERAAVELYSQIGAEMLVINGYNQLPLNEEITLGFKTTKAGNFVIKASQLSNIEEEKSVILKDKLLSSETALTEGSEYAFTSEAVNTSSRFSLILRAPGFTTNVDNNSNEIVKVYVNAASRIVINAPLKSSYAVYNTLGMLMENGIVNSDYETQCIKLTQGVYFVSVNNVTSKVIIK